MMDDDLFMAVYEEHKQRTRHDVFTAGSLSTTKLNCNVCLYLDSIKRKREKAEREYYEREHKANDT